MNRLLLALIIACTGTSFAENTLKLSPGERIVLVGGDLAVRLQAYGTFETLLHARFPRHQLVVRGLGWPADEPNKRQRPSGYDKYPFLEPMKDAAPDVVLCFFGFSESFRGEAGVKGFSGELENFVKNTAKKYPTKSGQAPRFVLVSPVAFENQRDTNRPEGVEQNKNLALYTAAAADAAKRAGAAFVDLFTPTQKLFAENKGAPLTVDGGHLNARGEALVGQVLDAALFGGKLASSSGNPAFERLRAAVNDKNAHHFHDYRTVNSMYIYGGRREPFGDASYPPEFAKLRKMVTKRDERIWALARGEKVPDTVDDGDTGELPKIPTGFGQKDYSEPKELKFYSAADGEKMFKVAPGLKVQLFASEEQFPELAKPVQLNFDSRGRLWVSTMPSYPAWQPGDGAGPNDKLLIFEDTDGDGRADKRTVFAEGLHCPTGFEFWNGGVIIVDQPRLIFLKDTDGDDRADVRETWFDGFGSDDTHHAIGAFEWSPGGSLQMLEGISLSTTIETIYGSLRENGAKNWIVEPRSMRVTPVTIGSGANPWGFCYERWGQGFIGDGTSGSQTWYTPLTGKQFQGRRGLSDIRDKGFRPTVGSEFLVSRQFPEAMQNRYLVANVIGFQGIGAYEVREEGSGYAGRRVEDIIDSTDRNCRPVDPQIGPDGAIWFGDWHTPLIGHMQYSQRDPNRDHKHGRIYRVFAEARPLLEPPQIAGAKVPALLELLKEYEDRTRYRVRRELRDRPAAEVLPAVAAWVNALNPKDPEYEHHLVEALWVTQGQRATDAALLQRILGGKEGRARVAALQVLGDERATFPDAFAISKKHLADEHPRARLVAVRNLSFFDSLEAAESAVALVGKPMDRYLTYTVHATLGGLQPVWKPAYDAGKFASADGPARDYLLGEFFGNAAKKDYKTPLSQATPRSNESKAAIAALSAMKGKAENGKAVYGRICIACHKVGAEGADLGPDLSAVGTRLTREQIYESIFFPNVEISKGFETVTVTLKDGTVAFGFIGEETGDKLVVKLAGGIKQDVLKSTIAKRESLKVSTMPEALADTMAQPELVDLVEYLSALKGPAAKP